VFEQTRIPDALIDGRLPESPHQLREAGRLLGVGPRGERLAECAESALVVCAGVRWLFARLHGIAERADWVEHAQEFDRLLYGFASVVTAGRTSAQAFPVEGRAAQAPPGTPPDRFGWPGNPAVTTANSAPRRPPLALDRPPGDQKSAETETISR
jgi:hypothetical protein